MTHDDREMWRINIENDADQVCSIYGEAAVDGVFQRYDATCFDVSALPITRKCSGSGLRFTTTENLL